MPLNYNDPNVIQVAKVKCLRSVKFHTRYFFRKLERKRFIVAAPHSVIFEALERVLTGKCKRLIINIAPRYGKTDIAVKYFISHGLALNAAAKFIHLSYSDDLALDNSLKIKDIVTSAEYQKLFPHVKIRKDVKATEKWYTTEGGGVLARATGGQITGFGAGQVEPEELVLGKDVDEFLNQIEQSGEDDLDRKFNFGGAIVIDDPIKPEDADSDVIREKINERYDSTIKNRVNSRNTPIVLICQRTHPRDLAGYLMREENKDEQWEVISLPSINQHDFVWRDGDNLEQLAEKGAALWPHKHTLEELHVMERANEVVYMRQYMQDPEPKAGLMFPRKELNYFKELPEAPVYMYMPVDPANLGGDDFSAMVGALIGNKIYVTGIIYNTDGEDTNSKRVVETALRMRINGVGIEGVMGWNETALAIIETLERNNFEGETRVLHPRTQKHVRIKAKASFIKNHFVFWEAWQEDEEYAKFMRCLTSYKKIQEPGRLNKRDDAPDNCEMMASFYMSEFPALWPVEYELEAVGK